MLREEAEKYEFTPHMQHFFGMSVAAYFPVEPPRSYILLHEKQGSKNRSELYPKDLVLTDPPT